MKSVLYPFLSSPRPGSRMSRLRRVTRQMMGYLGTSSLGLKAFYKNVLCILSVSKVLVGSLPYFPNCFFPGNEVVK